MSGMLVSIVMPCYNSEKFIAESIMSVLAQTYECFELIIIDNMSSDSSVSIIETLAKIDFRIKLLKCKKKGAAEARNYGIKNSRGRFLAFLDSDDLWDKDKLSKHVSYMMGSGSRLTCSSYRLISEDGVCLDEFNVPESKLSREDLLRTCSVGCLTVVVDFGGVDSFMRPLMPIIAKEDYAYWFVLLDYFGERFSVIPHVLASYRVHKNGVSSKKYIEIARQWNVYRGFLGLRFARSLKYILCYIVNGIKKTYL
ncbi:glycosyltransferase family 2 protein [Saccharophagus degradans]|uniref:B-glycosyltransferase-like protein n=1 Tax=Saccharophagus degradans (strain 2-40 / ATCC 43961 / DSM 17024) TaxID=203122 RepID=Q21IV0_SACD2|nr:glycosyltransferase family 2 protein [Saccharophagus degradans]ABD81379.1 b-glycosyltransferase-like protein [Saccharophagus degradans 2-40]